MYAAASSIVDLGALECRTALVEGPERWFPRLVSRVGNGSARHVAAVGFKVSGMPIAKRVEVLLGAPVVSGDWTTIPIAWKPTFPAGLFPAFEGRLRLVPHGEGQTRLTVSGTYEPPFDALGRTLDDVAMHVAAEATLKQLAESIAAGLNRARAAH